VSIAAVSLAGCSSVVMEREPLEEAPTVTAPSPTGLDLAALPPPARKIDVAIYNFPDLTGQNKPNDNIAEYSRAVTQGGTAFVIDALRRAGGGSWFSVVERNGLANLLQERQLIRATRSEFEGDVAKPLPPIRFAGLIVEGGILAYDANTITGGVGARYLGIGGDVKYRRDVVTVGMRIVSVQTGDRCVDRRHESCGLQLGHHGARAARRGADCDRALPDRARPSGSVAARAQDRCRDLQLP